MTKIICENNVNDFIFACSFILFYFFFFYFCQNHLIVTSDVSICTGYTISANTLNLYIFRNNSKNECLIKVKAHAVCLFG